MITRDDIARLSALTSEHGIVSAYIKVDPQLGYQRGQPVMKFKGAYARARRTADEAAAAAMEREHPRILEFLESWKQNGRAIAIFACSPDKIWEVIELPVMLPTYVSVGPTPDTQALARVLEMPRVGVLLLAGGDARLYVGRPRAEEQEMSRSEEIPNRHDQGGWSQARYQRHVDFHRSNVLREVAEETAKLFHGKGFDRLVLVGIETTTKEFEGLLPDPVRKRVIGRLSADFKTESDDSILARAHEVAEQDRLSSEAALVEEAVNYAAAGGRGATGIDNTLAALTAGNVDSLLVAEGMTADGSACLSCDHFSAGKFTRCPICGSTECEDIDVIDRAVDYAFLNGSHVIVTGGAASALLQSHGGMAAVLRYPPPVAADQQA